jgi:hypothetical protein
MAQSTSGWCVGFGFPRPSPVGEAEFFVCGMVCSLGGSQSPDGFSTLNSGFNGGFDGACGGCFTMTLLHVVVEDGEHGGCLERIPEVLALHDFSGLPVDVGEASHLALFDESLEVNPLPR